MAVYNNILYVGTSEANAAAVVAYNGATGASVFAWVNGTVIGTVCGQATTDTVSQLLVFDGSLYASTSEANLAQVCRYEQNSGGTASSTWVSIVSASGTIASGGTANIDGVTAMTNYNGDFYIGTSESNSAEIYRYNNGGVSWTKISNTTAGGIPTTSPPTTLIDEVLVLQTYGTSTAQLFAGTSEAERGEFYQYSAFEGKSYGLKFNASSDNANAEQNGNLNIATIKFIAEDQTKNGGNDSTGRFYFTHGINTSFGAYDIAEDYPTRDYTLGTGDLVSIDPSEAVFVKKTSVKNDATVIGVVSTNPALRLTQADSTINGGRAVPVALAGRVLVKVSTESGQIKSGDFLTSSSQPGVAMKAVGNVPAVAQALEPYSGEGVGEITVFIRGASSATQNLVDGIETIDMKGSAISYKNSKGEEVIKYDENGNAFFAGTLTADKIKANSIEGLEIWTDKIASLQGKVEGLATATDSAALSKESVLTLPKVIEFDSGKFILDLTVLGKLNAEGGLIATGPSEFKGESVFKALVDFLGNVIFRGDVSFLGRATFNKDTAGLAVIKKDQLMVEVTYDREYKTEPIVTISVLLPKLNEATFKDKIDSGVCSEQEGREVCQEKLAKTLLDTNVKFVIDSPDKKGFTLLLGNPAPFDTTFSWHAFAVSDSTISVNEVPGNLHVPFEGSPVISNMFGEQAIEPLVQENDRKMGLSGHDGVDFVMAEGTVVQAVDDGEILEIGQEYGKTIVIQHVWGRSYYGHLSEIIPTVGQKIAKGEKIALSGNTGLSTGPHMHFGILLNKFNQNNGYFGKVDPLRFLSRTLANVSVKTASQQTQILAATTSAPTPIPTIVPNLSLEASSGATVALGGTITINTTELGYLRVRSEPSTTANEVGQVSPGESFTVLDEQDGWYKIEYPQEGSGTFGWIRGSYVTAR